MWDCISLGLCKNITAYLTQGPQVIGKMGIDVNINECESCLKGLRMSVFWYGEKKMPFQANVFTLSQC